MQSPIESEFKIPSLNLDTIKQQQKQTYRLRNVRAGYVLYRALVVVVVVSTKIAISRDMGV